MTDERPGKDLEIQHEDLRHLLDRLELLLSAPPDTLPSSRTRRVIETEIRALKRVVSHHFAYEEKNGYLGGISKSKPRLSHEAEKLCAQHAEIRGRLESLVAACADPENDIDRIGESARTALDLLRHHERAENALLERILVDETGSPGD